MNITPSEWKKAKAYFEEHPTETKMRRKEQTSVSHSFIQIDGEIYAMEAHHYCGIGGFGKVKVVQNQQGTQFALKIQGKKPIKNKEEKDIMRMIGYLKGTVKNPYKGSKLFLGREIQKKYYGLLTLHEGQELFNALYITPNTSEYTRNLCQKKQVSESDRLIIALEASQRIQELHALGIIHCDIKAKNFMMNKQQDCIVISPIDFGLSALMKGKTAIEKPQAMGTKPYAAPEIINKGIYSYASDVYALGVMLAIDLDLSLPIMEKMLDPDPKKRPNIAEVVASLTEQLTDHHAVAYKKHLVGKSELVLKQEALLVEQSKTKKLHEHPKHLYESFSLEKNVALPVQYLLTGFKKTTELLAGKKEARVSQLNSIKKFVTDYNATLNNAATPYTQRQQIATDFFNRLKEIKEIVVREEPLDKGMIRVCDYYQNQISMIYPSVLQSYALKNKHRY